MLKKYSLLCLIIIMSGCAKAPPDNIQNICSIFKQYPKWYWASSNAATRWGVPSSVQMAILYQESRFRAKAKPPRTKLLWIIPWKRPSSAYGYTQALDGTWEHYKKRSGGYFVSRNDFSDAVNFIGWYAYEANRKAGIPKNNAYQLYLAYHEGIGGYQRGTYRRKPWLMSVAKKVQRRANLYQRQLNGCRRKLERKPWWRLW